MLENKIYSMLSLCQRAGKLCSGSFTCERAIKNGKCKVLIIAEDVTGNTKPDFENMCKYYKVPMYTFSSKEKLGRYIGKSERAVVGIMDINFATKIEGMLKQV